VATSVSASALILVQVSSVLTCNFLIIDSPVLLSIAAFVDVSAYQLLSLV